MKLIGQIIVGVAIGTLITSGIIYLIARNSIQQQAQSNKLFALLTS